MRVKFFHILAAFALPARLMAGASEEMNALAQRAEKELCKPPFTTQKECQVSFETATANALQGGERLWAFSFALANGGVKTPKEVEAARKAIAQAGANVLETEKNRIAAIAYFRESDSKFLPLSGEGFHRLALNPVSGVVARLDPGFLRAAGEILYTVPDAWNKEGLATATTGTLVLNVKSPAAAKWKADILNLDDQRLSGVSIAACRRQVATKAGAACDAAALDIPAGETTRIELDIKAGRNIHSDQPAFKVVIRNAANDQQPILNLAIPFKPRPNYFLFGVTGFLFGGLIAVMVIMYRKRRV